MIACDPLTLPLLGTHLIEASAGTGKTFTLAALYVRQVLTGLLPPQILVVTFTEAATEELRDRIRQRLIEAAHAFRAPPDQPPADPFLRDLREQMPNWPACIQQLELAGQWMDEAAILTIHGWCQRVLRSYALDVGGLFDLKTNPDLRDLMQEAGRDYWRRFVYPLNADTVQAVHALFSTPDALIESLYGLTHRNHPLPTVSAPDLSTLVSETQQRRNEVLANIKTAWREAQHLDNLREWLEALITNKQIPAGKLNKSNRASWLQAIEDWLNTPDRAIPALTKTAWERLSCAGLQGVANDSSADFSHPALTALGEIQAQLDALPSLRAGILAHSRAWIETRMEQAKHRRGEIGFDDMIHRVARALHPDSPHRAALSQQLRTRLPVAMIDEFQDTDAEQYQIFQAIYGEDADPNQVGFFMIGDPKQAIYGFRGGDIFTYIHARHHVTQHHTLLTNYRSTETLVEAVNALFSAAGEAPFLYEEIPFHAVTAQGRSGQLLQRGAVRPAVQLCVREDITQKAAYFKTMAKAAAADIADLLQHGQWENAMPVSAHDIAVLVRDRHEAKAIRHALQERGIRSVYLSDQSSVFASQEAQDLLRCLKAVLFAEDGRLLRAALATATLGWTWAQLAQFEQDEQFWDAQVARFQGYRRRWQRRGVLPMLHQLLHDEHLPQRLLAHPQRGERQLTNLLHLGEWLQSQSLNLEGELGLIRHLADRIAEGDRAGVGTLRLESESKLVRVVTIHKSKGLQYPIVYLPFVCTSKPLNRNVLPAFRWHEAVPNTEPQQYCPKLDLDKHDEQGFVAMQREQLAEDIRLIYVALTRAESALWLGVAPLQGRNSGWSQSGFGYVLSQGQPQENTEFMAAIQAWQHAFCPPTPEQDDVPEVLHAVDSPPATAWRAFTGRVPRDWWISSYSGLIQGHHTSPSPKSFASLDEQDDAEEFEDEEVQDQIAGKSLRDFYRGPQAGVFLHGLLERAGRVGFADAATHPFLQQHYTRHRAPETEQGWEDFFAQWLPTFLATPLPLPHASSPFSFDTLPVSRYRIEVEFMLGVSRVPLETIHQHICAQLWPDLPRARLEDQLQHDATYPILNGVFKGFIDLLFEHEGRYYILDYKSNTLGQTAAAYTQAAMQACMVRHRYDLQAVLYTLALHRQLKQRLGERYDYAQHMGGFVYVFLRGNGSVVAETPSQKLIETLDQLFQ